MYVPLCNNPHLLKLHPLSIFSLFIYLFVNLFIIYIVAEPQALYRKPAVTSAEVGLWRKDDPLAHREPWTYTPKHSHVNSEMTRSVSVSILYRSKLLL